MGKRDSAPTYGWVFMSQLNKWFAYAFLLLVFVTGVYAYGTARELEKDCVTTSDRTIELGDFWIHVSIGKEDIYCTPAPTR